MLESKGNYVTNFSSMYLSKNQIEKDDVSLSKMHLLSIYEMLFYLKIKNLTARNMAKVTVSIVIQNKRTIGTYNHRGSGENNVFAKLQDTGFIHL